MKKIIYALFLLALAGCNETEYDMNEFYTMYGNDSADVRALLTELSSQKIIFGHQSVGRNILSGLSVWEEDEGVQLNHKNSRDVSALSEPVFQDFGVGQNGDPNSKIDDFVTVVEAIPAGTHCAAFFKFCYVDFEEESDVDAVFEYYKEKMFYLKDLSPDVKIILVTVPLTTVQSGLKATVKKVLSRQVSGVLENVKRSEMNARILNELGGDFPIFDMAGIEATLPDGEAITYKHDGNEYPCMPDIYTNDGGHLNDFGAKTVSYNLLTFLAEILK